MTNVVRTEGTSGSITWLLPDKLSNTIDGEAKKLGDKWKQGVLKEITDFMDKYTHFLYATLLSPPDVMHETLNDLNNFINMEAKIAQTRIEQYKGRKG
jgi:hypothetical protein